MDTEKDMIDWLQRSPNPNFTRVLTAWLECEGGVSIRSAFNSAMKEPTVSEQEQPYVIKKRVELICESKYNKKFGDDRECGCGHAYYRHFDTYEDMYDCGCKYCDCRTWHEGKNVDDLERKIRQAEFDKQYEENKNYD